MNTTMLKSSAIFESLCETYPTSEALFAYLKSAAGGSLIVRTTPDDPLALIHYQKDLSDMTLPHVTHFRSVIWDQATNRPVAHGPAKFLPFSDAIDAGVDMHTSCVEDFEDGVMINLFEHDGEWEIATRTVIGAECSFYGKRTFAELFWETFDSLGLTEGDLVSGETYTFVLRHPEERIVTPASYNVARIFLVASTTSSHVPRLQALAPMRYNDLKTLKDIREFVSAFEKKFGPNWQGLVLKAADGTIYKLRSAEYDAARQLRGNQANRGFIWLERWSEGRLPEYLRMYPEEDVDATAVVEAFKAATKEIHDYYMKVYRRRELPLGQAPQKYRKLLWDARACEESCAYFPNMRRFMNSQDTARKLWLVNWERRFAASGSSVPA